MLARAESDCCYACSEDIGRLFEDNKLTFVLKLKTESAFSLVPKNRVHPILHMDWPWRQKNFNRLILGRIFDQNIIHPLRISSSLST